MKIIKKLKYNNLTRYDRQRKKNKEIKLILLEIINI